MKGGPAMKKPHLTLLAALLIGVVPLSASAAGWTPSDPLMPTGDSTLDTANLQAALHDSRLDSGGTLYLGPGTFEIHGFIGRQNYSDSSHPSYSTNIFNGTIQGAGKGVTILKGVRGPGGAGFEPLHYEIPGFASDDHTLLGLVQVYLGVKDLTFDSEATLVDPYNAYGNRGLVNYVGTGSFEYALNELIGTDITNVHFKGSLDSNGDPETGHLFQQWGDEGGVHNITSSEFENSSNGALEFFELANASIVTISHNEFRNSVLGIYLYHSDNSRIEGNEFSGEGFSPMGFETSENTTVSNNFVTGNWVYGITPLLGSNDCTITGNLLGETKDGQKLGMSSLFGAISVWQSDNCIVSGNKFVNMNNAPSLGAVWVSGQFNRVENNDYTESGLPGWNAGPGAIMLARFNGAVFDRGSTKNYVLETQYPAGTDVCDQVQGIQGNNVQALISGEVAGVNPGMCSAILTLEIFNESNAGLLQQMAEMQVQREEAWGRSRRAH
jgi:parallel beta-helix repeat protein